MRQLNSITLFLFLSALLIVSPTSAKDSDWGFIIPDDIKKDNRADYAERAQIVFRYFLNNALRLKGRKDFDSVIKRVKNRIFGSKTNRKKTYLLMPFTALIHK
jgi:hypothetical protein